MEGSENNPADLNEVSTEVFEDDGFLLKTLESSDEEDDDEVKPAFNDNIPED